MTVSLKYPHRLNIFSYILC